MHLSVLSISRYTSNRADVAICTLLACLLQDGLSNSQMFAQSLIDSLQCASNLGWIISPDIIQQDHNKI